LANSAGSLRSSKRNPDSCFSSNRFPATVAITFGSDRPRFSLGQDKVTLACLQRGLDSSRGAAAPGSEGPSTSRTISSRSTRAAARAFSSGVSPGTGTNVPLDCSPAMLSAAASGESAVSIR
jgi:hypothetical protein